MSGHQIKSVVTHRHTPFSTLSLFLTQLSNTLEPLVNLSSNSAVIRLALILPFSAIFRKADTPKNQSLLKTLIIGEFWMCIKLRCNYFVRIHLQVSLYFPMTSAFISKTKRLKLDLKTLVPHTHLVLVGTITW
jgi:hypothetical protein